MLKTYEFLCQKWWFTSTQFLNPPTLRISASIPKQLYFLNTKNVGISNISLSIYPPPLIKNYLLLIYSSLISIPHGILTLRISILKSLLTSIDTIFSLSYSRIFSIILSSSYLKLLYRSIWFLEGTGLLQVKLLNWSCWFSEGFSRSNLANWNWDLSGMKLYWM